MARGRYFREGKMDGADAARDTDWEPGELARCVENDEFGAVIGAILENWSQMADSVYYELKPHQLDQWEEGFIKGFTEEATRMYREGRR